MALTNRIAYLLRSRTMGCGNMLALDDLKVETLGLFHQHPDIRQTEIPESKRLAPDIEKIKRAIRNAYGVDESARLPSGRGVLNEPRNVAVFLVRRLRGEKPEEIGRQFGIAKYSSVSSAIEKMKREVLVNRKLRLRVKDIEKRLLNSQQQP